MTVQLKETSWPQLASKLLASIGTINEYKHAKNSTELRAKKQDWQWAIIYEHSLAKTSKSLAEQYYAPQPLPVELDERFNERIETSRNQLIAILMDSGHLSSQNKSFCL